MLSGQQYERLQDALKESMEIDKYGKHTILNVYCDNDFAESIQKSISKPAYKEKLRLRAYGTPSDDSTAFLEIKKKYKGVVYKRRIEIPYKKAWDYLNGEQSLDLSLQQSREVDYLVKRMDLKPYVFVGYDRIAMFGKEDKELRITFDTNIRYRYDDLDLRLGDNGDSLLDGEYYLMEIKCAGAFPMWLVKILSAEKIYPISFSKVGTVFTNTITERKTEKCLQIL